MKFNVAVWKPEDETFWKSNKFLAFRTVFISLLALHLAFAVWFTWSALVVRLPGLGFQLTVDQRFWLPAMALLMGAIARSRLASMSSTRISEPPRSNAIIFPSGE